MTNRTYTLAAVFFLLAQFLGCGVTGNFTRIPSTKLPEVENKIVVSGSKDQVWSKLITGLASSYFVINIIDKSSGFINVSYSGDPEAFVDGGELVYTVNAYSGKREYRFPASRHSAAYEEVFDGTLSWIDRQLDLEGRINVLVSEVDSSNSLVMVNVRYLLTLRIARMAFAFNQETISFNTGRTVLTSDGIEFRSTGKLEHSIFDMVAK